MLKKRLMGVITVRNGIAVQSFGYKKYLPIGDPSIVAENLDRFGVDSILLNSIDRSYYNLGPDFELINKVNKLSLTTPIIYSGGINNISDALKIINLGIERVSIDSSLFKDIKILNGITNYLGKQAVIAAIPISIQNNIVTSYCYLTNTFKNILPELNRKFIEGDFSELLLIDYMNEGNKNSFNMSIVDKLNNEFEIPLIVFGGITESDQVNYLFKCKNVNCVGIGNSLNYKEHSVQQIKESIQSNRIRLPYYNNQLY